MNQSLRTATGAVLRVPLVAAVLMIGIAAQAAPDDRPQTRDTAPPANIDERVKHICRNERPGSVEHSICRAEARRNAWRTAAEQRREPEKPSFSMR